MSVAVKRVCIVGAGPSGLVSIKSCLEEGLEPTCFEMAADIGGLWNNTERNRLNLSPKVYPSLLANVSKINSAFSDFPFPEEWPPFVPWEKYLEYDHMYAERFDLMRFITFNVKVVQVSKSSSYTETGSWLVKARNLTTEEVSTQEYDAIIVASGRWLEQVFPDFPGLHDQYKGEIIHSGDYDGYHGLEGKSIVVVGSSNSGCDIAADCSKVARKVMLSSRSGTWLMPRVFTRGLPLDIVAVSRFKRALAALFPSWIIDSIMRRLIEERVNLEACGLSPRFGPSDIRNTRAIVDELPLKLYTGQVTTRPNVQCFSGPNTVKFVDGKEDKVDVVIFATGYKALYPFLPKEIFPGDVSEAKLYFWIFPFLLEHPSTLAFVGLIADGGGPTHSQFELQARFAASVMSGKRKLPSKPRMKLRWEKSRETLLKQTGGIFVFKQTIFQYQEELANELGLIPSFLRLLFTDPRLAFKMYFGPLVPYHYRLIGDHCWHEARDRSLRVMEDCLRTMKS